MEQVPPTAYERTKSWRLRNPEKVKELNKKYRDKPENKAKKKEYNKKHKVKLAEQRKEARTYYKSRLKTKYGITLQDYDTMLAKQNYSCAICGKNESEQKHRLSVDHNHTTGEIRGLLCVNCNHGIGKLGDSIDMLQKAIKYLLGV